MKRLATFLIGLTVASTIVLVAYTFVYGSGQPLSDPAIERAIRSMDNADSIRVALNDSGVREGIAGHRYDSSSYDDFIFRVENASNITPYDAGFVNVSGPLVRVTIFVTGNRSYMDSYHFYVVVDPVRKTVMERSKVRMIAAPESIGLDLPPGAAWFIYTAMGGGYIDHNPGDAPLYAMKMDKENFSKFKNGEAYEALTFNGDTGKWLADRTAVGNNTIWMLKPGQSVYTPVDNNDMHNYYFVLLNGNDKRNIAVELTAVFGVFQE
ncbi:MAG TPA: hypothetical protein VMC84_13425 [Methanocella sp.]|uniref:hypothetical protein n=1 Tax=Methanocella sp. TaxID=2052833 RepID=UPI002D120B84|nr:hypothetical protein [Methanocella sp.]HTY92170.1 hypothetical protein [Methanocella sp.]